VRDGFQFEHSLAFDAEQAREVLASIPAAPGVFALFGHREQDQPYLTRTANLRRRLQRLLLPQPEAETSRRLLLGHLAARIEYSRTGSEFEATLLLFNAIRHLQDLKAAERRLRLHAPFMVRLAAENPYPRCYVTNHVSLRALQHIYGPFATRAAAERFLDESLNLFKLRRCADDLNPDPAFPGCVYSEMKMCLAPCFRGCSDERYAEETHAVSEYLASHGASLVTSISAARESASAELDFERAATLHAAIGKAQAAAHLADEIVRPISQMDAVIVQKAAETGKVALFMVQSGMLAGPVFAEMAAEDSLTPALAELEAMRSAKPTASLLGCHLALLKRWYFRSEKQRKGEILYRNEDGSFPLRRLARALARVGASADTAEAAPTAETGTLAANDDCKENVSG
jgi:excinuclease UvrABC nuclease subunit